ncbi:MAG: Mur ligase family protein [Spirochaetes bacterium]|nr:Mur ligase family protein [Spirochaetota bacterium]
MQLISAEEGFLYLQSFTNLEMSLKKTSFSQREYRLDRVKYLFEKFGNPHKSLNLIHIAGSKGKGCTALFAASMLRAMGFKTGLYTSPHVLSFKERVSLSGTFFEERAYVENINLIKDFVETETIPFESGPTTFELLTLLAFLIFRYEKCSWAVIETGMGGRLDATNIITPLCSVITPIELEHTEILGNTHQEIAFEKAGIIKKNVPVVTSRQRQEVLEVLKNKAEKENSILTAIDEAVEIKDVSVSEKGTCFSLSFKADLKSDLANENLALLENLRIETKMIGAFQAENSSLALLAVKKALAGLYAGLVTGTNFPVDSKEFYSNCKKGIADAFIPGRIEYIFLGEDKPALIVDSSHTVNSAEKLAETIMMLCGSGSQERVNTSLAPAASASSRLSLHSEIKNQRKIVLIFGIVEGKDYKNILKNFTDLFPEIIISTPGTFKKSNPEAVYEYLKLELSGINARIYIEKKPENAFQTALEKAGKNGLIVVAGSFYLAGEIKSFISK